MLPGVTISEGTVVGAMSLVMANQTLEPWSVYAGIPARKVAERNRESVMRQVEIMKKELKP